MTSDSINYRPILRWAGGKSWMTKHIDDLLPKKGFNFYHEPFIGGASMLCHLQPPRADISDLNNELITTYLQIRDNVDLVLKQLKKFKNTKEEYLKIRAKEYKKDHQKAARFIYLNQTSFNGIYRVNSKGKYNVPYGQRKNFEFNYNNIISFSNLIKNYTIKCIDFYDTLQTIEIGDFVFLDPPYTVVHNCNGFVKYNAKIFDEESQIRLSKYIDVLQEIGAHYILTNAAHKWVYRVFKKKENSISTLNRYSSIGGVNAKRGSFQEFIITNIQT